jgi:uncharacterized coiled-coil protein SlyX
MGLQREGSIDRFVYPYANHGLDTMQPIDPANDRLVRIESALMHLSHDVEAMHQAIISQQREVDAIRRTLDRLQERWDREEGLLPEVRDPAAEKPPHY